MQVSPQHAVVEVDFLLHRLHQRMRLRYSGPHGQFPVYVCTNAQEHTGAAGRCQEVRALGLDAEVERLVLEALAPDRLHIALAALEQVQHEDALLRKQ